MRLFTPLLAVAAVWALFMPSIGPLVDHHFTERHPHHAHVYPEGTPLAHEHPFERPHVHEASADHAHAPGDSELGIVFLPPGDGGAPGLGGTSLDVAPPVPAPVRHSASLPTAVSEAPRLPHAFATPLEPPPPRPSR